MKPGWRAGRNVALICFSLGAIWGCGFDTTLRAYLNGRFWQGFVKTAGNFARAKVRRVSKPFAGMTAAKGDSPLEKLRAAYQKIEERNVDELAALVAAARADQSLGPKERDEVSLIDAKIDMRIASNRDRPLLEKARTKFRQFLKTGRTPEFLSEGRGWLARVEYLLGNQSAAGKIYLDELNRDGSNLTEQTVWNSLQIVYGYDGGPQLLAQLADYFDTPEHATFAIEMATNPHWDRWTKRVLAPDLTAAAYPRIRELLEQHKDLLKSEKLALLALRTALRMGDAAEAKRIAEEVPADAAVRNDPDFLWMAGASQYLSHEFAAAEPPLLALFHSSRANDDQRSAAAYGLCGVYYKTGNVGERLRYALWLHTVNQTLGRFLSSPGDIADFSVYWNSSGWDLDMLLDTEASTEDLQSFIDHNPDVKDLRLVKYGLAVRLTREDRYEEAAKLYDSIHAIVRGPRTHRLAMLYQETQRDDITIEARLRAKIKMAEFLMDNRDRIYFNDTLWFGLQTYALQASEDGQLTREENEERIRRQRKLQDDQEELWRAYRILREVVDTAGRTELGRQATVDGLHCLWQVSGRFGRSDEIEKAELDLQRHLEAFGRK